MFDKELELAIITINMSTLKGITKHELIKQRSRLKNVNFVDAFFMQLARVTHDISNVHMS